MITNGSVGWVVQGGHKYSRVGAARKRRKDYKEKKRLRLIK